MKARTLAPVHPSRPKMSLMYFRIYPRVSEDHPDRSWMLQMGSLSPLSTTCTSRWGAVPDPLGGETLPLVGEVYGWLCWANQGTSRRSRNRPFDAVLLRRDGGNREAPPGGWAAPEDHERVLRSVIRAAWPDREPTWPAFLEGGAVLRITDADANNWLPRALRSALAHWRYRRHNPPPPQPQPPHKRRRK